MQEQPETTAPMKLDATQEEAIALLCDKNNRIASVTGAAGTGKTTILKSVHRAFIEAGYTVAVVAPTGKAAKRIKEATGIEAVTIHRLLEFPLPGEINPKTGKPYMPGRPARNQENRLEYDIVLADEYAMVNWELHNDLIFAMRVGGALRLFGDVNQLRPIEENVANREISPFMKMLDKFPSKRLTTIHRQQGDSNIVVNANLILRGQMPRKFDDFSISITDKPIDALMRLMSEHKAEIDFASIDNQIVVLQNKGWIGTVKLNGMLQSFFHPETGGWIDLPRSEYSKETSLRINKGDKVIWTKNNYDLSIFNGETGVIEEIFPTGEFRIDFGDRSVHIPCEILAQGRGGKTFPRDPRVDVDLAYAITTHKTQGSEYKNVVYLMNKSSSFLQGRGNFYTGITRAKKRVFLVCDQPSLVRSLKPENVALFQKPKSGVISATKKPAA